MRTKCFYLICLLSVFGWVACDKMPVNGRLDGMWQLQQVDYDDGTAVCPEYIYYNFQLELCKLTKVHNSGEADRSIDNYLGRFEFTGSSLQLYDLRGWVYRQPETPVTAGELAAFGIPGTEEHFDIEKLTADRMILRSATARLSFRKF